MSPLRVIKCPKCGVRHYIGHPCDVAESLSPKKQFNLGRAITIILVFAGATVLIVCVSLLVAEDRGKGYGVAIALGVYLTMHMIRIGHEWDDGIDFFKLMLPAPWDWSEKFARLLNFWTMPRPFFRAVYLASVLSLIIVLIARAR